MSCLTGPRCYINTDIQHEVKQYKPIHKLTYCQLWLYICYIYLLTPLPINLLTVNLTQTHWHTLTHTTHTLITSHSKKPYRHSRLCVHTTIKALAPARTNTRHSVNSARSTHVIYSCEKVNRRPYNNFIQLSFSHIIRKVHLQHWKSCTHCLEVWTLPLCRWKGHSYQLHSTAQQFHSWWRALVIPVKSPEKSWNTMRYRRIQWEGRLTDKGVN